MFCPTAVGTRGKGGILFPKRIPPLEPPEKGEGRAPRPPALPDWSSKSCTRCALHSRWQLCCLTDAQQRMIGAEASRIAMLTRLCRAQAFPFRRQKAYSNLRLPIKRLSFGRSHRPFSFSGKKTEGVLLPPAGGIALRTCAESHRSSSSNFIIASSCSRICAFIGPSSRWS